MCHFIMSIFPQSAKIQAIELVYKQQQLDFRLAEQPDVRIRQYLNSGEACYWTGSGVCDCGTALLEKSDDEAPDKLQRQLDNLRKKGWREQKIQRWLSSKSEKSDSQAAIEKSNYDSEIVKWQSILGAVLSNRLSPYVCLLVFWDDKDTLIKGRIDQKHLSGIAPFKDNIIYKFS